MSDAPLPTRRRWGRRLLFLLLLLGILGVSGALWLGSVASARLEEELLHVRDAGESLTLAELAPPPVPEAENAAPLLLEAFELVQDEPDAWTEGDRLDRWEQDPFGQDEAWYAELAAWVASNEPAIEKAREAAARPSCRFDLEWEKGIEMESPQVWGLLTLSRARKAQALLAARDGDVDRAIAVCADMVRLARIALQDPLLIYLLVRAALVDAALDTAQEVLARGPAATGALRNLLARLDELPEEELHRLFLGERAFGYSAFDLLLRDPAHGLWEAFEWKRGLGTEILYRILPRTLLRLDGARYLSLMRRQIELARRPYRETRPEWADLQGDASDAPWYAILSPAALTVFPVVVRKWTSHEAKVDVARLGLALALHRREHGALPGTLADLPGTRAVDDPFRDAPYVVETTGDGGFLVYSVGPDRVDDGGAPLDDDERGDLVWRHVAHP